MKINGHAHLLPEPHEIPAFMRDQKIFWIDEERTFMYQNDWRRPITDPSFFLEEKIQWMDKHDIDHAVILTLSQLYCNGMDSETAKKVLAFQNDFNAKVMHQFPARFTGGFVVQPACMEVALAEIERCVKDLEMPLLCLPTHFPDKAGKWHSIGHPSVDPIWELANEFGLAVEVHPYDGPKFISLEDQYWRFHLIWMCAQTADAYHFFALRDIPSKFPNVRTCFAHGNQVGQVNLGRRIQGYEGRPDLFQGTTHPAQNSKVQNVYFDTLVHDVYSFRLLMERQGTDQIIAGLDDPYPLGEMETVPGCYPGKVLDEAVAKGFLSQAEKKDIWSSNVLRWLSGGQSESIRNRIQKRK